MLGSLVPQNSLELERAKFAYFGRDNANNVSGAGLVVGAGRLGTVLPLALASGVTAGQTVQSGNLLNVVSYPITPYASGEYTYWPNDAKLYISVSGATTVTFSTSPDGTNFYTASTWTPTAAASTVVDFGSVAAVEFSSSAAVTVTAQLQITQ